MTLPPISPNQDINRELPLYRNIKDPYYEEGLISIMFLGCGRHDVTRLCLKKLMASLGGYNGQLEWIFLEQGWDVNNEDASKNLLLFKEMSTDLDRSVIIILNKNYGINVAINQMNALSRGQYSLFMENDWVCHQITHQWLVDSKMILDEWQDIGVVQLRAIHDPNDNHGKGKVMYNPFSVDDCSHVKTESINSGTEFLLATHRFAGINNNPSLIRKEVHRELGSMREPEPWSDLRNGETDREEKYMKTQWLTAHLMYDVFFHYKP